MMTTVSNVSAAQVLVASHQLAENAEKRRATERQETSAKGRVKPTGEADSASAVTAGAADAEQTPPRLDGYSPSATARQGGGEAAAAARARSAGDGDDGLAARLRVTEGLTLEARAVEEEKRTRVLQRAASGYAVSRAALR